MKSLSKLALVALAIHTAVSPATAEETMRTLAQGGKWSTIAHYESALALPDVCVTVGMLPTGALIFRKAEAGFEVRVRDQKWSLPTGVTGNIKIVVGTISKEFEIGGNDDQMIAAIIQEEEVVSMFLAMDKASTLQLTVGKSKPIAVSLAGSARATNAFRTCARLRGNVQENPESNPF